MSVDSDTDSEPVVDPRIPIVDAHHHLWFLTEPVISAVEAQEDITSRGLAPTCRRHARYLLEEFLSDIQGSGHNIRSSVFVDSHAMYRETGPEWMRSVGEVEFANGVAAMSASGLFGDIRVCAGIVGGIDLRLGDAVEGALEAHLRAGGCRYRGVRAAATLYDEDLSILGATGSKPHLLKEASFRAGFRHLDTFKLSFDVLLLEPQLPDLLDLAQSFPGTQIVLNHIGVPIGVGRHRGYAEECFQRWKKHIGLLARCENVAVKLGGLGLPFQGVTNNNPRPPSSSELAAVWRPHFETCIEAFGVGRCMFISNFPVDSAACTYRTLWNAFKLIALGASETEKTSLFSGTATRIYRLGS